MKAQIIFGSQSDEAIYQSFAVSLQSASITNKTQVLSAHRNPKELKVFLENLEPQIIVAGAGLAAHLPGVVASLVSFPVFGVPVKSQFDGLDAFLSIVQMPKGVPVACVFKESELNAFLQRRSFEEKIFSTCTNDSNASLEEASILIANLEEHKKMAFTGLRVLWAKDEDKQNTQLALEWHKLAVSTGVWVGMGRLENAKLFLQKMRGVL